MHSKMQGGYQGHIGRWRHFGLSNVCNVIEAENSKATESREAVEIREAAESKEAPDRRKAADS